MITFMSSTESALDARTALGQLRAALDGLLAADLGAPDDDTLLDVLREVEVQRRRLAAVDARLVGEIDARGAAHDKGARDTATLLRLMLRVDPGEARGRVAAARDLSSRITLSGDRLEPALPATAAAVRAGDISRAHASIIARCIDALPLDVQAVLDREIEQQLVDEAARFAPYQLKSIATRINFHYDQDGRLASDADRTRRRSLTYRRRADGTVSGEFVLDQVTGEAFETVLDSLLADASAEQRGDRTPAQLRHDALRDLLLMFLRGGHLPATGGVTTTMIVTLTLAQWAALTIAASLAGDRQRPAATPAPPPPASSGRPASTPESPETQAPKPGPPGERLAVTHHGAKVAIEQLVPLLGDSQLVPVVLSALGPVRRVEAYGTKHRIFSENQRLALAARDGGCSFPGCTSTPPWCEAHHVVDHTAGGATSVDNGTLLCPYHHRSFADLGYTCVMDDGTPRWIAPPWIDPLQVPHRNTAHDPTRAH